MPIPDAMPRSEPVVRIVQVNLQSDRGGDGRIVSALHERYRALGYPASLLVGRGRTTADGQDLLHSDEYRSAWARRWISSIWRPRGEAGSRLAKLSSWVAEPKRRWRIHRGFEDFDFPATYPVIAREVQEGSTILHLHNLHGGYFDLRALPALSDLAPVVLTLHDQWTFTGHCAYSFECARWRIGCGECPDLTIYPGIPRDRTADNFVLKRDIFSRTRLYLTAPSRWLLDMAERSLLGPAIEEARVIPNGVDTAVFHPGDRAFERSKLALPSGSRILLCAGSVARADYQTDRRLLRSTLERLAERRSADCSLVFLGAERRAYERIGAVQVFHRPFEHDVSRVASYYRASDLYLHAARSDNFPTAVLESLASGVPAIATRVGGIPEQVKSLWGGTDSPAHTPARATGILVGAGDTKGMTEAIELLLQREDLRAQLGANGPAAVASEFTIARQVERNLSWYREILRRRHASALRPKHTQAQTRSRQR